MLVHIFGGLSSTRWGRHQNRWTNSKRAKLKLKRAHVYASGWQQGFWVLLVIKQKYVTCSITELCTVNILSYPCSFTTLCSFVQLGGNLVLKNCFQLVMLHQHSWKQETCDFNTVSLLILGAKCLLSSTEENNSYCASDERRMTLSSALFIYSFIHLFIGVC